MKRFHISIGVTDFAAAVADYSNRLGCAPAIRDEGRYALWKTELLNFTISCKKGQPGGQVRHIGFEDDSLQGFEEKIDSNGIIWEYFSAGAQEKEIAEKFPGAVKPDTSE